MPGGSFPAPDHEFPVLPGDRAHGARRARPRPRTATRRLDPQTVQRSRSPAGPPGTPGSTLAAAKTRDRAVHARASSSGSTNGIGADSPQTLGRGAVRVRVLWSNAGARTHTTQVNADTTLTATFNPSYLQRMAGTGDVGKFDAVAAPGQGEVYRTVAEESGTATELWLSVDNLSCASDLVLGLYADGAGPRACWERGA